MKDISYFVYWIKRCIRDQFDIVEVWTSTEWTDDDGVRRRYPNDYPILRRQEQKITINRKKRLKQYFKDMVWPELMAERWHPRNMDKWSGWGFDYDI